MRKRTLIERKAALSKLLIRSRGGIQDASKDPQTATASRSGLVRFAGWVLRVRIEAFAVRLIVATDADLDQSKEIPRLLPQPAPRMEPSRRHRINI